MCGVLAALMLFPCAQFVPKAERSRVAATRIICQKQAPGLAHSVERYTWIDRPLPLESFSVF